jgi:hypothetical protein
MNCFASAPLDIVNYILSFDNRFRISNGIPISIVPKDDPRYTILKKVCRFHDYYINFDGSERERIDRWALGSKPCKVLSFLQDSFYVILVQRKNKISFNLEHRRVTIDKTTHLYYSYDIHNYGYRRPSLRIKNMKK